MNWAHIIREISDNIVIDVDEKEPFVSMTMEHAKKMRAYGSSFIRKYLIRKQPKPVFIGLICMTCF